MVEVLGGKAKFQAYPEQIGLRVPRAVVFDQGHDEQALDDLSMPVVLKPADKALVLAGVGRAGDTRRYPCGGTRGRAPHALRRFVGGGPGVTRFRCCRMCAP
ncbi:MAG: hypothetical protein ACLPPT_02195 [Mycobacterium sp.]|uniref:hypothetical protein n=1 Tax=Mycobacterium sp. TaxID=1785 RepID=UPI003F970D84